MAEGIVKAQKVYRDERGIPTLGVPERMTVAELEALTAPTGPGTPPEPTVAPAITGTATSGETLTLSAGTYTGSPSYTRQWLADGEVITGATGTTLVLGAGQVGKKISARVIASNAYGTNSYVTPETAVVAAS